MKNYNQIVSGITNTCWAIMPNKMDEMMCLIHNRILGIDIEFEAAQKRSRSQQNKVAILPLYGVMSQKVNVMTQYSGGTSTEIFGAWFDDAMADDTVGKIIIDVDSPGGSVYGIAELSRKIYKSRGKKPIIAVANSLIASAAYWVASAADEIHIAADEIHITPGGEVGSVGVIAVHVDRSEFNKAEGYNVTYITAGKYKAEANPDTPLDKEAKDFIQSRVDDYYSMFINDVARNRGLSTKSVIDGFGQGRVYGADMAIKSKMADKISTLEYVMRLPA
jgi:capsid assembly protease